MAEFVLDPPRMQFPGTLNFHRVPFSSPAEMLVATVYGESFSLALTSPIALILTSDASP